jgi:hypothetical protein
MILSLIAPVVGLALLAVLVPRGIERLVPETIVGIGLMAVLSAVVLWLLSAGGFALLYLYQDSRILTLLADTPGAGSDHFLRLGANAALIWAPVLILVVTTAPRRWKTAVW